MIKRISFLSALSMVCLGCTVSGGSSDSGDAPLVRSEISEESRALISECAVGLSSSTQAKIEAVIKLAERKGSASAGLEEEIRGVILADDTFSTDAAKLEAYKEYNKCASDFRVSRNS